MQKTVKESYSLTVSVLMFCKMNGYVVKYKIESLKIINSGGEMCG
jgi:hypothetical protein